jgi:hypothetical protein
MQHTWTLLVWQKRNSTLHTVAAPPGGRAWSVYPAHQILRSIPQVKVVKKKDMQSLIPLASGSPAPTPPLPPLAVRRQARWPPPQSASPAAAPPLSPPRFLSRSVVSHQATTATSTSPTLASSSTSSVSFLFYVALQVFGEMLTPNSWQGKHGIAPNDCTRPDNPIHS